jgi:hypothetical protein
MQYYNLYGLGLGRWGSQNVKDKVDRTLGAHRWKVTWASTRLALLPCLLRLEHRCFRGQPAWVRMKKSEAVRRSWCTAVRSAGLCAQVVL